MHDNHDVVQCRRPLFVAKHRENAALSALAQSPLSDGMIQKVSFGQPAREETTSEVFLLSHARQHSYWDGHRWVADPHTAQRFESIDAAVQAAQRLQHSAVNLQVLFPRSQGRLIIPLFDHTELSA